MACFVTKPTPIIIINSVSIELKMTRTCLIDHAGFIHMNALEGGHTDIHRPWTKIFLRDQFCAGQRLVCESLLAHSVC